MEIKLSDFVNFGSCKVNKDEFVDPDKILDWPEDGYLTEDMVQIAYPEKKLVIDVGWYGDDKGRFVVYLIKNADWENPLYRKESHSAKEVIKIAAKLVRMVEIL